MATVPRFKYIRQCEESLLLNLTPQTPPNDTNGHHVNDDRVDKCQVPPGCLHLRRLNPVCHSDGWVRERTYGVLSDEGDGEQGMCMS